MQMSPGVIASPVGIGTHKMNKVSKLINTALDRIRGVSSEAGAPKILPKGPYVIRNLRHAVQLDPLVYAVLGIGIHGVGELGGSKGVVYLLNRGGFPRISPNIFVANNNVSNGSEIGGRV